MNIEDDNSRSRRSILGKAGLAGVALWVAPSIVSIDAAAAQSAPPCQDCGSQLLSQGISGPPAWTVSSDIDFNLVTGEYTFQAPLVDMSQVQLFDASCAGQTLRFTYSPVAGGPSPVAVTLDFVGVAAGEQLIGTFGIDPLPYDFVIPALAIGVIIRLEAGDAPFLQGSFSVPELTVQC